MSVKMDIWERIMLPERVRIPYFGGLLYRTLSKIARKRIAAIKYEELSLNKEKREQILTCSLTSFPDRINTVEYTIKSLFTQSVKPDRIVLWLAASEFENVELPDSIKALQERGLELRYCDNLFEHKRYYKMIDEQAENELLVMFDDDIIFPYYAIERLYEKWKQFPDCIICERGQCFSYDKNGEVMNAGHWPVNTKVGLDAPSFRIMASPGGGCIVPPHALYKDANNEEVIKQYALKTGDIWLMFMAAQNDTKTVRTYRYHRIFILSEDHQTVQLGRDSIYQGRYVKAFDDLSKAYPHAYQNILSDKD